MMPIEEPLHLHVLTPEKTIYQNQVSSVVIPSESGSMGILPHHAPLVSRLIPGKIIITDLQKKRQVFQLKGTGFAEVANRNAVLLLDEVETIHSSEKTT